MSSGNLPRTAHPDLFRWSADLDPDAYVRARYRVGSLHDAEATAIGMAMEQSAATTAIAGHVQPSMLVDWTIRVVSVDPLDPPARAGGIAPYHLATEVWQADVAVKCVLHECTMPLKRVMKLEIGDTLMFDARPDSIVSLRCGDFVVTEGRIGRVDDKIAVRVVNPLRRSKTTLAAFDSLVSHLGATT